MVVALAVELAVLGIAVVIGNGDPQVPVVFGMGFPLDAQLEILIGHAPRFLKELHVIAEIAPHGGITNGPIVGIKLRSGVNVKGPVRRHDMARIAHPAVKPELVRRVEGSGELESLPGINEALLVSKSESPRWELTCIYSNRLENWP